MFFHVFDLVPNDLKPVPEPLSTYCQQGLYKHISIHFLFRFINSHVIVF